VNNTDAEGRLTLADALVYACNQGVEKVYCKLFASFYLCTIPIKHRQISVAFQFICLTFNILIDLVRFSIM